MNVNFGFDEDVMPDPTGKMLHIRIALLPAGSLRSVVVNHDFVLEDEPAGHAVASYTAV